MTIMAANKLKCIKISHQHALIVKETFKIMHITNCVCVYLPPKFKDKIKLV